MVKTAPLVVDVRLADLDHVKALLAGAKNTIADLERELLDLKGPCSNGRCRLHYAHSGPCDERRDGITAC